MPAAPAVDEIDPAALTNAGDVLFRVAELFGPGVALIRTTPGRPAAPAPRPQPRPAPVRRQLALEGLLGFEALKRTGGKR
ncbi:MAG: hypothetical protein OZ948_19645 [Deltaproteobacteria bacterium]|nr:hypothetical protein [Deltaproteobacteria bacterium]